MLAKNKNALWVTLSIALESSTNVWRYEIQHNDIQLNDIQHNDTQHKGLIL
jgi:hypothetical protein